MESAFAAGTRQEQRRIAKALRELQNGRGKINLSIRELLEALELEDGV